MGELNCLTRRPPEKTLAGVWVYADFGWAPVGSCGPWEFHLVGFYEVEKPWEAHVIIFYEVQKEIF